MPTALDLREALLIDEPRPGGLEIVYVVDDMIDTNAAHCTRRSRFARAMDRVSRVASLTRSYANPFMTSGTQSGEE